MSKFFKALERLEQERAGEAPADGAAASAPGEARDSRGAGGGGDVPALKNYDSGRDVPAPPGAPPVAHTSSAPSAATAPTTESRRDALRPARPVPKVPPRVAVEATRDEAAVVVASMAAPMADDAPPVETARIVAESAAPTVTAAGPREGERGGVYGAPRARENGGSRFDLEPMPASVDDESGQLDDHLVRLEQGWARVLREPPFGEGGDRDQPGELLLQLRHQGRNGFTRRALCDHGGPPRRRG